jgi:hypothetical protein
MQPLALLLTTLSFTAKDPDKRKPKAPDDRLKAGTLPYTISISISMSTRIYTRYHSCYTVYKLFDMVFGV